MVNLEVFRCFTKETYNLFQELHKKKIISDEEYGKLERCENIKEAMILIQRNFSITENEIMPLWKYIIYSSWKWKRANRKESNVFNDTQSSFIKELTKKNGVYERNKCLNESFTDQQISTQIRELEDMNYISSLRISKKHGNKTIFILNPEMMREIRNAM